MLIQGINHKGRDKDEKGVRDIVSKAQSTQTNLTFKNFRHKYRCKGDNALRKTR